MRTHGTACGRGGRRRAGASPARLAKGFQSEGRRCAAGPSCSATSAAAERDSSRSAIARSSFCRRVGRAAGLPCLIRGAQQPALSPLLWCEINEASGTADSLTGPVIESEGHGQAGAAWVITR